MSTWVTDHAVRRYAERKLGIFADVEDDHAYVRHLWTIHIDVDALRGRLSGFGDFARRYGAPAVIADGMRIVVREEKVVTVLERAMVNMH